MNATGSYKWWYFDAVSDDGKRALSAILFVGSVFSPSYAARLRRGEGAKPGEHVAVNLALYENGKQRSWVMSEYGAMNGSLWGESSLEKTANGLRLTIRDRSAPFLLSLTGAGTRVEGTVELEALSGVMPQVKLDGAGQHRWQVQVPRGRVKVRFTRPAFEFEGVGYHDINEGDSRLEAAFSRWSWARFHEKEPRSHGGPPLRGKEGGRTFVLYSAREKNGTSRALIVDDEAVGPREVEPGVDGERRNVGWGLRMPSWFSVAGLRCDPVDFLQVAPFYARYSATLSDASGSIREAVGQSIASGMGEYLDLERFSSPGIQFLLRFKTRRV